jgi:hypothetical protein
VEKAVARRTGTTPKPPLTGNFSDDFQAARLRAENAEFRQHIQSLCGTSRLDFEICRVRVPETLARARRRWN